MPTDLQSKDHAKPDRVEPACAHFGLCGGCQLQRLAYSAQLAEKSTRLRALLETAGLALPQLQLHPSPPLAYRNRIRLTLAQVAGQIRAGYLRSLPDQKTGIDRLRSETGCPTSGFSDVGLDDGENLRSIPASHGVSFLPISECPIAAPILWRVTEAFLTQLNESAAIWLHNPQRAPDQIEIFTTADQSRLQFTFTLRSAAKSLPKNLPAEFNALCESLRAHIPELIGAGIAILPPLSPQRSRRNEQPRVGPAWGSPGLSYSVATNNEVVIKNEAVILPLKEVKGKNPSISSLSLPVLKPSPTPESSYWVPRGAFFQVNRFLLPELLSLVTANRGGQLAFDLYAGVGLFSRTLTAGFAQVTAVEIAEPAASALAATKLRNLNAVKATTLDFLRIAVVGRDRPDLIVLDPPRTGAGPEVCALLARIAAPTLVYVSCSPEKLPADLVTLAAAGYRVRELHLFDLFPQTTHIETVAILTR